ncbi:disulfide bond formation protein B [Halobacteriales archaeon QS_1_68_17]|nr:MAG: disulfide bond formation protein B [Halobacteriales archaeon QS_1_68_17]
MAGGNGVRLRGRVPAALGFAVAAVATLGSLNYSLGMGLFPCRLCWYQRILMYPLVVAFGYALATGRRDFHLLVLPLSVPGVALAGYHSSLQVSESATCSFAGCGAIQFRLFGALTIPNQSLIAFLAVTAVGLAAWVRSRGD